MLEGHGNGLRFDLGRSFQGWVCFQTAKDFVIVLSAPTVCSRAFLSADLCLPDFGAVNGSW